MNQDCSYTVLHSIPPPPKKKKIKDNKLNCGRSGSIGDNSILGDTRWGGLYGVDADFVAAENCKICCVASEGVLVRPPLSSRSLWCELLWPRGRDG
jgi:hypothetical protein